MAYFEFVTGRNVLPAIPITHGGFRSKDKNCGGNYENHPAKDVVKSLVLLHIEYLGKLKGMENADYFVLL